MSPRCLRDGPPHSGSVCVVRTYFPHRRRASEKSSLNNFARTFIFILVPKETTCCCGPPLLPTGKVAALSPKALSASHAHGHPCVLAHGHLRTPVQAHNQAKVPRQTALCTWKFSRLQLSAPSRKEPGSLRVPCIRATLARPWSL